MPWKLQNLECPVQNFFPLFIEIGGSVLHPYCFNLRVYKTTPVATNNLITNPYN